MLGHGGSNVPPCAGAPTFAGRVVSATDRDFDLLASRSGCLSADESARARAFRRRHDATAFIARRVFLREVLAAELNSTPEDLVFDAASNGKPELGHDNGGLWFNQSATSGRTVVALSRDGAVGLDVERLDRPEPYEGVARRWFTRREMSRLARGRSAEDVRLEFMRIWTAREAAAKLTGEGMAVTLSRHEVLADPMRVAPGDGGAPIWIDQRIEPPYVVSVAWSSDRRAVPQVYPAPGEPPATS